MIHRIQSDMIYFVENYLLQGILFATVFSGITLLGYMIYLHSQKQSLKAMFTRKHLYKASLWYFMLIYFYMIIAITLLSRSEARIAKVNLKLFSTFGRAIWCQVFIYENILMFVPYGIFVYLLFPRFRKIYWMLGIGFCSSLLIEATQYVTRRGYFQIDDIFNNVLGMIVGYSLGYLIQLLGNIHKYSKKIEKQQGMG